ncbi:DUF4340 domain-containing protein [Thiorhodospira sibirica]|uniref:DUF4340 domain-containing protein n=1 Tax=Thiorhodospira sibirica TaxID=154347 RepID=UPI00022C0AF8|nr:DUF4340 domain-containing protein [Thiorhodospira sibirica]
MSTAHRRRLWINLSLAIIVILLLSLAWWLDQKDEEQDAAEPLLNLSSEALTRIEIGSASADSRAVVLTRDAEDKWWVSAPIQHPANPGRVHQLTRLLALTPTVRYSVEDEMQLHSFGLSNPQHIVRFNDIRLSLGQVNPVTRQRYARVDDGDILLIPDYLTRDLPQNFAAYVSPRLLPEGVEIVKVELPQATLSYDGDHWEASPADTVDAVQARLLADTWEEMVAAGAEALGSQTPEYELTLHLDSGEQITFQVLETEPVLRLARPDLGIVYILPAGWGHDLIIR